jgi:hypothetical protein
MMLPPRLCQACQPPGNTGSPILKLAISCAFSRATRALSLTVLVPVGTPL